MFVVKVRQLCYIATNKPCCSGMKMVLIIKQLFN